MGAQGTVLIVDDDREVLESLRLLLEMRLPGVRVLAASDGHRGLELVAQERPTVIVSDYRMPGMDGIEFLKRTLLIAPKAARLMMSAYAGPEVASQAVREANVALLVTKPFQLDYFVQLVGSLLSRRAPP